MGVSRSETTLTTMTADRSTAKDPNSSRKIPYSEAFRKFIVSDWEPYSTELPQRLPAADHTPARHQEVSTRFRGATLVIPAGPMKVRSNDTDYRLAERAGRGPGTPGRPGDPV